MIFERELSHNGVQCLGAYVVTSPIELVFIQCEVMLGKWILYKCSLLDGLH